MVVSGKGSKNEREKKQKREGHIEIIKMRTSYWYEA
jgi:hypothetical protein